MENNFLLVLFYSASGSVKNLAHAIADGIEDVGLDVRLRTVPKISSNVEQIKIDLVKLEDEKEALEVQLIAKEEERAEFLSEHKELEDSRIELVELRGQKKSLAEQHLENANQHRRLADDINRTIMDRVRERDEMLEAMLEDGLSEDELPESIPNVGELERKLRTLDKKLDEFGLLVSIDTTRKQLKLTFLSFCERFNQQKDGFFRFFSHQTFI